MIIDTENMNCEHVESLLIERDDLGLSFHEAKALERHLAECASCRESAKQIERITRRLQAWSEPSPSWLYWRRTPRRIVERITGPRWRTAYWPAPAFASLSALGLIALTLNLLIPLDGSDAERLEERLWSTAAALPEQTVVEILEEAPESHPAESYVDRAAHELADLPLPSDEWAVRASIELHIHLLEADESPL